MRADSETVVGVAQALRVASVSPLRTSTMVANGPQRRRGTDLLRPMGHRSNHRMREEGRPGAGLGGFCAATTLTSAGGARCWLSWRTSLAALRALFLSSKTGISNAKYTLPSLSVPQLHTELAGQRYALVAAYWVPICREAGRFCVLAFCLPGIYYSRYCCISRANLAAFGRHALPPMDKYVAVPNYSEKWRAWCANAFRFRGSALRTSHAELDRRTSLFASFRCSGLTWHFQDTDPDFGQTQAKNLQLHFEQMLAVRA